MGKTTSWNFLMKLSRETPPRTWGRRCLVGWRRAWGGNTPTHVGKTQGYQPYPTQRGKHPHARGEDDWMAPPFRKPEETPPRTWGRLDRLLDVEKVDGNTPTHVGKTKKAFNRIVNRGKHPHARGEDSLAFRPAEEAQETPPRTWGRPATRVQAGLARGNTPTHVGKTACPIRQRAKKRKHPHARGEDILAAA